VPFRRTLVGLKLSNRCNERLSSLSDEPLWG